MPLSRLEAGNPVRRGSSAPLTKKEDQDMTSGCPARCNNYPKQRFNVNLDHDVRIPMTDGVGIYADIYRPRGAGSGHQPSCSVHPIAKNLIAMGAIRNMRYPTRLLAGLHRHGGTFAAASFPREASGQHG